MSLKRREKLKFMRAVTYTQYGSPEVLRLVELPKPAPKDNEVLVKVRTTTVTIGDVIMRSFNLPVPNWQKIPARIYLGIRKPKRPVLGMELAGDIEAVGKLTPAQWKRARAQANICLNVHKDSGNGERPTDLQALKGLVDAGKYTPVVDRYYPLEEIVEAHRYVETGRKRGNVVIKVS